ncbi:hypothetical protein ACIBH1_12255 [Nonomuraea sp. NPDC050663]|uniref:hypothetical protein n=1 Tax=Nonomuraea sp. NPDC050663 TaxID=3364370 RepID=UPI0037B5CB55
MQERQAQQPRIGHRREPVESDERPVGRVGHEHRQVLRLYGQQGTGHGTPR